jgi:protein O-mannosyl-transferase
MSKQVVKKKSGAIEKTFADKTIEQLQPNNKHFYIYALVLTIIGFVFYSNSFYNEYALDDGIVIKQNEYVQQGFKGISKIMSTDSYDSFYRQMGAKQQLSGGRYRPLSVVTFAIEQQLFGSKEKEPPLDDVAFIRHVINVVLYVFSIIVLFYLLFYYILPEKPLAAFGAILLFLTHPLHTEVISNVKSRDEIMSLLFIGLTFIMALRYRNEKKLKQMLWALVFYFMALLSKEYAITLVFLLPILFYILKGDTIRESIVASIPYIAVAFLYLLIRFSVVGKGATTENPDVLNNPYLFATKPEKLATKIEILNHYLRLLFYPWPLSSDYSYSTIPYVNFGNWKVWLSIVLHITMVYATIKLILKRHILGFALAVYMLHLFMISSLLMDIGATMGERLIYHSSLGFVIAIGFGFDWLLNKISVKSIQTTIAIILGLAITICFAYIVIPRNEQWKNDTSLFLHDSNVVPYSVLVNGNAGQAFIKLSAMPENKAKEKELLDSAIVHLNRAINTHKRYVNGYLNIGVAYYQLKQYDKAKEYWDIASVIYPNNPYLLKYYPALASAYHQEGMALKDKPLEAIPWLEKATQAQNNVPDFWYNLGGAYFTLGNYTKAREAWQRVLSLDPNNQNALNGIKALPQ